MAFSADSDVDDEGASDEEISSLPDCCLHGICAFLLPRDILRVSCTNILLNAVADSDVVWQAAIGNRKWLRVMTSDLSPGLDAKASYFRASRRELAPLVFDLGSTECRVGFSSESIPVVRFSTDSADLFDPGALVQRGLRELNFVGHEVESLVCVCVPTYLPSNPCKPLDPSKFASSVLRACFDFGEVRAVRFESSAACALRSHGVGRGESGLVVHCGCNAAHATAVSSGTVLVPAEKLLKKGLFGQCVGGHHLTKFCLKLLERRGTDALSLSGALPENALAAAQIVKERACYVREARTRWQPSAEEMSLIELPVKVSPRLTVVARSERYEVGEALFEPQLLRDEFTSEGLDKAYLGLHELALNAADSALSSCCGSGLSAKKLFSNIVVEGGGLAFPGVRRRLRRELSRRAPTGCRPRVIGPPPSCFAASNHSGVVEATAADEYILSCWRGAALLAEEATADLLLKSRSHRGDLRLGSGHHNMDANLFGRFYSRWAWLDDYKRVGSSVLWARHK